VLLVPLLFAAACGGGSGSSGATTTTAGLPGVAVVDLATGDQVDLASYVPADRPVLVWMWAPF
jgi:hypothetical protein